MKKILLHTLILSMLFIVFTQCQKDTNEVYTKPTEAESKHANDIYLKEYMLIPYGTAVRWRWDDRFIKPTQKATPINADLVVPVTKVIEYLWIGAYESQGEKGKKFMKSLFPAELQYIGSYIFQNDGSRLLGYAEGGARITLLNLNSYDLTSREWLTNPGGGILATVHHEFTHIVHQNFGLPAGFKGMTDYVGNGWMNITPEDALKLGTVSKYSTLNEFEDFCELLSHFLTLPKEEFEAEYITIKDCSELTNAEEIAECKELNLGREKIAKKLNLLIKFYKDEFGLDLVAMRDTLESRINYVIEHNKIPEK